MLMRVRSTVLARMGLVAAGVVVAVLAIAVPAYAQTKASMIDEAGYTNAVATSLKSLQWTHFYGTFDEPAWAVLTIHDGAGREVARIFDGAVSSGSRVWFPSWNGKDSSGRYLPSSIAYEWRLRVNRGDRYDVVSGRIAVCRILFTVKGDDPQGTSTHLAVDRYMFKAPANVYLRATRPAGGTTRVAVEFPDTARWGGVVVGQWDVTAATPLNTVQYVRQAWGSELVSPSGVYPLAVWWGVPPIDIHGAVTPAPVWFEMTVLQ